MPKIIAKERVNQGFDLLNKGKYVEALEIFRNELKYSKGNPIHCIDIKIDMARCYCKMEQYRDAINLLNQIQWQKTDNKAKITLRNLHLMFSRCYIGLHEQELKLEFLHESKKHLDQIERQDDKETKISYAIWYSHNKNYPKALSIINEVLEACPENKKVQNIKLQIEASMVNTDQLPHFETAKNEKNGPAKLQLLKTLSYIYSSSEIVEELEKVILENGFNTPKNMLHLACAYEKSGSYNKAIELYQNLINANPNLWEAFLAYGLMLEKNYGAYQESINILKNIVNFRQNISKPSQPPTNLQLVRAFHLLAIAYTNIGNIPEAKNHLQSGLNIMPDNAPLKSCKAKLMRVNIKSANFKKRTNLYEQAREVDQSRWGRNHGMQTTIYAALIATDEEKYIVPTTSINPSTNLKKKKTCASRPQAEASSSASTTVENYSQKKTPVPASSGNNPATGKAGKNKKKKSRPNIQPDKNVIEQKNSPTAQATESKLPSAASICRKLGFFALTASSIAVIGGCAIYQNYYRISKS